MTLLVIGPLTDPILMPNFLALDSPLYFPGHPGKDGNPRGHQDCEKKTPKKAPPAKKKRLTFQQQFCRKSRGEEGSWGEAAADGWPTTLSKGSYSCVVVTFVAPPTHAPGALSGE